ncbi:MAG: hypothetical protein U0835_00405 [Isosphaeraceae bacterium]
MDQTIQVEIKTLYGRDVIYPACEKAGVFCKMLKQATLTDVDVQRIKELGFTVQVVSSHPATL